MEFWLAINLLMSSETVASPLVLIRCQANITLTAMISRISSIESMNAPFHVSVPEPICSVLISFNQSCCSKNYIWSSLLREEDLAREFGDLVRRLRYERGYSQAGFAEASRFDRAHMGEIERGEVTVTIVTALKMAQALGMSLSELFGVLEGDEGPR